MSDDVLFRPGFEFMGELPGKPTAMTTWFGLPIICTHDGPPCIVQRHPDGSFTITPITTAKE